MFKHQKNKELGITLIALVVTIIVLLILAGISINMLSGDNSILKRAKDAKEQTNIAQEKESVELAYISAAKKKLRDDVTGEDLQNELNSSVGLSKTKVTQKSTNRLNVKFKDSNNTYSVTDGKVEKIEQEDGIYVGNVRMGGIYLPDVNNMSYEDYQSSISDEMEILDTFFQKCQETKPSNSEYKDALESAEKIGISREWIDYAYNNIGDSIRNIQAPSYNIFRVDETSWDISIPFSSNIISVDKNFNFDLNNEILYNVYLAQDAETGVIMSSVYTNYSMNPEAISFNYKDENEEIPDKVQLPFGMVLRHVENPHTANDFINQWVSQEEATQIANAYNDGVRNDCIIEWQGRSFTFQQLREYILNNTKIVYNGQTVDITSEPSGEDLDSLFGISFEDLYINGYLD